MPRSDRSSDPDDGSITSDGSDNEEQVTRPTRSPRRLPFNIRTDNPNVPPADPHEIQQKSPKSPSQWAGLLDIPAKPSVKLTGPNARFKAAVFKVIQVNRMRIISDEEPGVDPRNDANAALYGHIREQCSIDIVDFGAVKYRSTKLANQELENFIAQARPLWAKVRWINIGGVSWDVIKCLALRYNIHPLSIEDMLHNHQTYSSKADYYSKHLFIRILCHTLAEEHAHAPEGRPASSSPLQPPSTRTPTFMSTGRYTSPPGEDFKFQPSSSEVIDDAEPARGHRRGWTDPVTHEEKEHRPALMSLASASLGGAQPWVGRGVGGKRLADDEERSWAGSVFPGLRGKRKPPKGLFSRGYSQHMASLFFPPSSGQRRTATQMTVDELKKADGVQVNLRNLFVLLMRDGTLITIHQDPGTNFFDPILSRVRQRDTLLRNTSDASMLLQNILDLVVDKAVMVVEKYQQDLLKHERDVLIRPKISTVRALHILSGEIAMHKRTLGPIKTLIYGLRRYDLDRCIATADQRAPGFDEKKVNGYLSHKSKIYLADVMDHMDYILTSLDMFGSVTENLIAYTFNVVSYDMNTTVKTLTIMTVIFLPLSFLTGYFGMNFATMPSVQTHNEGFFWIVAAPVMVVVLSLALYPNVISMIHYIQKEKLQKRIRALMS